MAAISWRLTVHEIVPQECLAAGASGTPLQCCGRIHRSGEAIRVVYTLICAVDIETSRAVRRKATLGAARLIGKKWVSSDAFQVSEKEAHQTNRESITVLPSS